MCSITRLTNGLNELSGRVPGNMLDCPREPPVMKVLSVRQPWASLIAQGKKVMDIRSRTCHYRGPVAIYATKGHVKKKDRIYFESILGQKIDLLPHGRIIACVQLSGTIRFDTPEKFAAYELCHCLNSFFFQPGIYGWVMEDVHPLPVGLRPFYSLPRGCVNWSETDLSPWWEAMLLGKEEAQP